MAGTAGNSCLYMVRRIVIAVAGDAFTDDLVVIYSEYVRPDRSAHMTGAAIAACGNMAGGVVGVMTTCTNSIDLIVVHSYSRYPRLRGMTGFARIPGIQVRRVFSCCDSAIVATTTAAEYVVMINSGYRPPCRALMARFAYRAALNMLR